MLEGDFGPERRERWGEGDLSWAWATLNNGEQTCGAALIWVFSLSPPISEAVFRSTSTRFLAPFSLPLFDDNTLVPIRAGGSRRQIGSERGRLSWAANKGAWAG